MNQYVTLLGAEDVSRAASSMRDSAHQMQQAASTVQYALQQHEQFMWAWLAEFQKAAAREDETK